MNPRINDIFDLYQILRSGQLNILFTSHFGGLAGSSFSIFYLAYQLKQMGHHVVLAIPYDGMLYQKAVQADISTYNIPFRSKVGIKSIFKINTVIRKEKIEIVSTQGSKDRYVSIISKIIFGWLAKIVITRRQKVRDLNPFKIWFQEKFSELTIVNSPGLQKILEGHGFDPKKISTIYNGLPDSHFDTDNIQNKADFSFGTDEIVIGCVSRLKRQNLLVECLDLLPVQYRLLLVGIDYKSYRNRFGKIPEDLIERVTFTGIINNADALWHYQMMNCCVLPSEMDGFGLVLLEAMKLGVPVIGSNFGGIPDVIQDGKSGLIFDNNNLNTLSESIIRVTSDEQLRMSLIEEGFKRAEEFKIEMTGEAYAATFEKVLGK